MPMKASTLGKVIEYFNPMVPLDANRAEWYVERPDSPHQRLKVYLLDDPSAAKILFSGHTGCGKSSTLNQLIADPEVAQPFFIVQFSVKEELNIADLTYTDLLMALGHRLFEAAEAKMTLDAKLKSDLDNWAAEVSRIWGTTDLAQAVAQGGIKAWFFSVVGKLKTTFEEKREFRLKIEPRVSQLIDFINRIVRAIETHRDAGSRKVLLVIEDLDKPPLDVSLDLFLNKGSILVQPQCKTIFTVPTSVLYSGQFNAVRQNFSQQYVLPNFKIKEPSGERNETAWKRMREIVERRLDSILMDSQALDLAVEMSGGVTRELVRMINAAATEARAKGKNAIKTEHVKSAVDELRQIYNRSLTKNEYVEILREVHNSKRLRYENEKPLLELLYGEFILEYPNGAGWYGVNPIVHQLIGV